MPDEATPPSTSHKPEPSEREGPRGAAKAGLRPWQKWLLVGSIVIAVAGGALQAFVWMGGDPEPANQGGASTFDPSLVQGLAARSGDPSDLGASSDGEELLDRLAPGVFRLGFGFFAGFCIGYAVRAFMKIAFIVIGAALLLLFGLQYAGLIDVDWSAISGKYDSVQAWLSAQAKDFVSFISGYIPSAASAALGAFVGARRT